MDYNKDRKERQVPTLIERHDLLALNFYKSSPFTGSDGNMRYRVEKITEDSASEESRTLLQATIWPEPYAYAVTPDDQKVRHTADFSEDGMQQLVDWMNEQQPAYGTSHSLLM